MVLPRNFRFDKLDEVSPELLAGMFAPFAPKFLWFEQRGYIPHLWQAIFHSMHDEEGKLLRFRHLVAGRRGGKTLSAAEDVAYYCMNPAAFHWDAHRKESREPIHVWVLTKDHVIGRAALLTFRKVLTDLGLVVNQDYREHRGNRYFDFDNGSLVEFKTADDPENLRGAGLDILWMDEAAFIVSDAAIQVVRPALSDKRGIIITTTTPHGKNWFYNSFWSPESLEDPNHGRVEYRSLDNPHFPREEWEYMQKTYHPLMFKQEYMASFDSMQGVSLPGEWLHYYDWSDLPKMKDDPDKYDLNLYLGVDPAISTSDSADRFSMALIGVTKDYSQVYLLEQYAGRIPFPEQVDLIIDWYAEYKPHIIGVEANVYQAALAQQALRHQTMPPIVPMLSQGQKKHRIMAMSPMFRIGRIKIRTDHRDFINEWLNYSTEDKSPDDDCLDAVEIALRTAGAILPSAPSVDLFDGMRPASSMEELARRAISNRRERNTRIDVHLGGEY